MFFNSNVIFIKIKKVIQISDQSFYIKGQSIYPSKFNLIQFQIFRMASSSPSGPTIALVTMIDDEEDFDEQPKKIKKINNYVIVKCIGSGSFSKVYLGVDVTTRKKYAIKRIKLKELCRSSSGIAQLEREIRLMRTFNYKNILKLYEVLHVEATHYAYLVLEYAEKGSLGALLEKDVHFTHRSVFSIMKQILGALKHLHDSGFVHQDIKPGNILIDENGRAILADFGIGHSFQSAAMVVGSPAFQAPECLDDSSSDDEAEVDEDNKQESIQNKNIHNKVDEFADLDPKKEDVWSLGVTLYQLLFNKLPFEGDNLFEIVQYIKSSNLHFPPGTDNDIIFLIKGMLTVDPSKRFSVDDVMNCPLISQADDLASEIVNIPDSQDIPNIDSLIEATTNNPINSKSTCYSVNDVSVLKKPGSYQIQKYRTFPNLNGVEQIKAIVCPKDYSFASIAMSIQRRLSCMNAPYSPDFHRRPEPFPRPSRSIDNLTFDDKQQIQRQPKNENENQQSQLQENKIISFKKIGNSMQDQITCNIITPHLIIENDEKAVPPC